MQDLADVGTEERYIHHKEHGGEKSCLHRAPSPSLPHDHKEEGCGDQHGRGHRHSIGSGQSAGRLKADHQGDGGDHENPVDGSDVDLADMAGRGMGDLETRKITELDGLPRERERPGDDRLRRDDGGHGGQKDHGDHRPGGNQGVERVVRHLRSVQQDGPLAKVVQDQRREDQAEPRQPNGSPAEVPHVGVQGLRPRHHQEHRAENQEAAEPVVQEKHDAVPGEHSGENAWVEHYLDGPEDGENGEPHHDDGPEEASHFRSAPVLDQEYARNDRDGEGNHVGREHRGDDLDTFDGAEHRDGRGDHAVPVQQAGAKQAKRHKAEPAPPLAGIRGGEKGGQRQNAALPMVIRPEHEGQILDRDDHDERPEHQGQDAQHVGSGHGHAELTVEAFSESIERTCADISVDHSQGCESEYRQTCSASCLSVVFPAAAGTLRHGSGFLERTTHSCSSVFVLPKRASPLDSHVRPQMESGPVSGHHNTG